MCVKYEGGAMPWVTNDKRDLNFEAAQRATEVRSVLISGQFE